VIAGASSLLGIAGVVIGAILTHITTARREQARMKFEAHQIDTSRYTTDYRMFLANWKKSISASHLEAEFGTLESRAYIPKPVRDLCEQTLRILRDGQESREAKVAAAEAFHSAVDALTVTHTAPE
jgi:hypothetical protein